jgi:hypothetical protein
MDAWVCAFDFLEETGCRSFKKFRQPIFKFFKRNNQHYKADQLFFSSN